MEVGKVVGSAVCVRVVVALPVGNEVRLFDNEREADTDTEDVLVTLEVPVCDGLLLNDTLRVGVLLGVGVLVGVCELVGSVRLGVGECEGDAENSPFKGQS